jgi:outer membrane protein assembly complex protein YaeT
MIRTSILAVGIVLLAVSFARAQPSPDAGVPEPDAAPAVPEEEALPAEAVPEPEPEVLAPPDVWTEWDVEAVPGAKLLEDKAIVRALLEPDMKTRQALTPSARNDLVDACARLGYQLVDIDVDESTPGTKRAILYLSPRLVVRRVAIDIDQWSRLYIQDELQRRMRLRVGEVLEVEAEARTAQLNDEARRLTEFLQDEGFFEAKVTIAVERSGAYGAVLEVDADLGPDYYVGKVTIKPDGPLAISRAEIRRVFDHCRLRALGKCRWRKRFTRAQHQADIAKLTEMYQRRGYPAARVRSDYDAKTSFDRGSKTVDFTLRIDERRRLTVEFEGNDDDRFSDDALAAQLTFDDAAAADDVEVAASALAIQRYYQKAGWFDAAVSWERDRRRLEDVAGDKSFDQIRFRIDTGQQRQIRTVEIVGEQAIGEDELRAVLQTKPAPTSFRLIGGFSATTTEQLEGDAARLVQLYQKKGYLEAQVRVHASPSPDALGDAALAAALLAAERGTRDLHVRFSIVEGQRTELQRVVVAFEGDHQATEGDVHRQLNLKEGAPFNRGELEAAGARLKDWYWHVGRPRAKVTLETQATEPYQVTATYRIEERQELRIGKVVVRGNFRTKKWVVLDELDFEEGALLTDSLYMRGLRRLRATGLFSAVSVEMINLDENQEDTINMVVHVEERQDVFAYLDAEVGYSDQKSLYAKLAPVLPNPFHNGISISTAFTLGWDVIDWKRAFESEEASLRLPRWWTRRFLFIAPDVELNVFRRIQDTERFGELTTYNATIAMSRSWQRTGSDKDDRAIAATLRYDFRFRNRSEDAVRVAGNSGNDERTTVKNRAGVIGISLSWDQRVDKAGNLNPLSPYRGFKLEGGVGFASRNLLGQDDFFKISGLGQWIRQLSGRLQLRIEGRYDQGIPLGGAVLLPEVERYFAGGDDTVRGFPEDRLATEIVEQPVPPFDGVTQIEVLPAGGNIRMLGSIDLQVRLWKLGSLPIASALYVDAGVITNNYAALDPEDVRPSVGVALARLLTPFGGLSLEWAVPLLPREHDPPQGRLHFLVALRY